METILTYLLKVAIAIAAFQLAYLLLFQKRKHFLFNRVYLLSSMVVSFTIPLITFQVEAPEPIRITNIPITTVVENPQLIQSFWETLDWQTTVTLVITIGTIGFFINLLVGHIKAISIIKKSEKATTNEINYRISNLDVHPFSFFNQIIIPTDILDQPHFGLVLQHEHIHVKEKHTIDVLIAEFLFLFQWFNPFAWLIKDAIKNNLEYLTDEKVIQQADRQNYQMAMVALADKNGVAPFLTALNGSQLKNRIMMMKSKTENQKQIMRKLALIPLLTLLIITLSNKEFKAATNPPGNTTISGKVTDSETGKEIPSVSVIIKGKTIGTITDDKGDYLIQVETDDTSLLFAMPGYEKQEVKIDSKKEINVKLKKTKEASNMQIRKLEIGTQPGEKILINDINGGATPLYIVDGEEEKSLDDIHPDDIKSVTVLKDASAQTLYGDKGKNGVILITTKHSPLLDQPKTLKEEGKADIKTTAKPLIIIDGVKKGNIDISSLNIDPEDIQSMNVIKDESALGEYGEQGKDGVIIVTTKK